MEHLLRVCILCQIIPVDLSWLPKHHEVGGFSPARLHNDVQPHLRPSAMGPVVHGLKPLNGKQK